MLLMYQSPRPLALRDVSPKFRHEYCIQSELGSSLVPRMVERGYECADDRHLRSPLYRQAANLVTLLNRI